ncbi:hypothetical protein AK830_g5336 [Neonectria ditissima]|uniref:Uncharacterized protein n=1 Tax=Neonectria ditissima TaxID=78410 RepID=A0A0N8H7A2_9HYPO|nr:hypothetical protein AK830_g5336 [Neonectria ditissima]
MWSNANGRVVMWALLLVRQTKATQWLNSLDGYDSLPACAEALISSIARDMVSGCGDGGRSPVLRVSSTGIVNLEARVVPPQLRKRTSIRRILDNAVATIEEHSASSGEPSSLSSSSSSTSASSFPRIESWRPLHWFQIAIGICIPFSLISLLESAFFLIRRFLKAWLMGNPRDIRNPDETVRLQEAAHQHAHIPAPHAKARRGGDAMAELSATYSFGY